MSTENKWYIIGYFENEEELFKHDCPLDKIDLSEIIISNTPRIKDISDIPDPKEKYYDDVLV